MKYEELKKEFIQRTENMAQQAVRLYFDVLDALSDIQISSGNLRNAGTNYEIEEKRVNLGTTSEDKLLQLELQVLNNSQTLEKAKYARYQTAKTIQKLTVFNNEIDEITIVQEVTILVKNFDLLASNILLAQKKDTVAERRYMLANNLFHLGKLTIADIGLAQSARDEARKSYLNALRAYWDAYYTLRRLTLYDFEKNAPLYRE